MPQTSRLTDIGCGLCCIGGWHPACGLLITASPDVVAENLNVSRISDIIVSFCHRAVGVMVTSSTTVNANNLGVVRPGDSFVGCFTGILVTGAPTVYTGG